MELVSGSLDLRISKSACNNQSNNLASVCSNNRLSEIDVVENKDIYAAGSIDDVENNHIYDAVYEILLRIDPRHLFKCVLVSKDWLSIITSRSFQKYYLGKWKNSTSILVGLFMFDKPNSYRFGDHFFIQPGLQLLPTSNLGQNMIIRTSRGLSSSSKTLGGKKAVMRKYMPRAYFGSKSVRVCQNAIIRNRSMGFFITKSPTGGHLLYSGDQPDTFYVCKPTFESPPLELPPPPVHYDSYMANVLSDDDSKYRVILACSFEPREDGKLPIQTYCSWTGLWEPSMLTCPHSLSLMPSVSIEGHVVEGGIVTCGGTGGGGVIYWKAAHNRIDCIAAWDINGGSCISEIPRPPKMAGMGSLQDYNIAPQPPQGSLMAATYGYKAYNNTFCWESEMFTFNIWLLDDDKKEWNLLHSIRQEKIWSNNLAVLNSLFDARPPHEGFGFVSFFLGKSDSIFVGLKQHLFVYHFHTGKLEYVNILNRAFGFKGFNTSFLQYHPLTMLDSGIWPSSPRSLQLPRYY